MKSNNYLHSKKRFALLLAQLSIIMYTIARGDDTAAILAGALLPLWILAYVNWQGE